jgi:predicted transcriptional regulator
MSIQPKWCELIASGKKTVEVRKTKPKLKTPFKVYIYETKGNRQRLSSIFYGYEGRGKIIGEFVCDETIGAEVGNYCRIPLSGTCLDAYELMNYAEEKTVYGWHISNLIIYDKPKELSEFYVYCDRCDKRPISCKFAYEESNENGYYSECMCDFKRPIERPPQSWCYVEELKEGDG